MERLCVTSERGGWLDSAALEVLVSGAMRGKGGDCFGQAGWAALLHRSMTKALPVMALPFCNGQLVSDVAIEAQERIEPVH